MQNPSIRERVLPGKKQVNRAADHLCLVPGRDRDPRAVVCRKMDISDARLYNWRKNYGGPGVSDLRRLHELDAGNRKLTWLVADLTPGKHMLQGAGQLIILELILYYE